MFAFPGGSGPGRGIPVFNAPFANTRSVAELMIGEIVCLARQLVDKTREIHSGVWNKLAVGCCEASAFPLASICVAPPPPMNEIVPFPYLALSCIQHWRKGAGWLPSGGAGWAGPT